MTISYDYTYPKCKTCVFWNRYTEPSTFIPEDVTVINKDSAGKCLCPALNKSVSSFESGSSYKGIYLSTLPVIGKIVNTDENFVCIHYQRK